MKSALRLISALALPAIVGVAASCAQVTSDDSPALNQAAGQSSARGSDHALEQLQPPATEHAQTTNVSQVRIVRLSQVKGDVRLDRNTDQKFELAFMNLPIVAGERLQTQDGLAEVEFEDNSSLRLTPKSLVEFPVLGRNASGATTTTVKLISGSLYVSLADSKISNEFNIKVGNETVTMTPSSHLRIDFGSPAAKLVVFKGSATLVDPSGSMVVDKKKTVSFDTASGAAPAFAHNDGAAIFDKWDKDAVEYHQARAAASSFAASPYAYGTNDLAYYGSFANYAGCGTLWRPYLATAAFDPYGSGVWSWYPGSGYSWVSPYPWGWTPFHSGSWQYCPAGGGWGWQPSGSWNGLQNQPANRIALQSPRRISPPAAPRAGQPTLVGVNLSAIRSSGTDASNKFVFRSDSAGMGVPREVFGNLGKISQNVAQRGAVSTEVSEQQGQRGMIPVSRAPSSTASSGPSTSTSMSASRSSSPSSGPAMSHASSSSMSSAGSSAGHH